MNTAKTVAARNRHYARYEREQRLNEEYKRRVKEKMKAKKRAARRAAVASKIYVVFLAFMSLLTVLACVQYLRLKAVLTSQALSNARLESHLVSLRGENDALEEVTENQYLNVVDLRDRALELGLHEPYEDQIVWYETGDDSAYIKQFSEVPK